MRQLARLLLAGGAIAALLAGLRKLFEGRTELLRSAATVAGPAASETGPGPPAAPRVEESRNGIADLSREELYEKAKRLEIEGRSKMNKRELARAVAEREAGE